MLKKTNGLSFSEKNIIALKKDAKCNERFKQTFRLLFFTLSMLSIANAMSNLLHVRKDKRLTDNAYLCGDACCCAVCIRSVMLNNAF